MHRQFADWYRSASISPTLEELEARSAAAEAAAAEAVDNPSNALDLVEGVYGLGKPVVACKWFVDALKGADPTIHLEDNDNTLRVLAGCILGILMTDVETDCSGIANAVLCTSLAGTKPPLVASYLSKVADGCVARWQAWNRRPVDLDASMPDAASDTLEAAYARMTGSADPAVLVDGIRTVGQQLSASMATQAKRQDAHMAALRQRITQQREELDMLWWVVGGWVGELAEPLSRVPPACAPVVVGWSLGGLIQVTPQPRALPAIIARALRQVPGVGHEAVPIVKALEALPVELRAAFARDASDLLPRFAHVAPVSAVLAHAAADPDRGMEYAARLIGIGSDVSIPPHLLALQICGERTMVRQLKE